MLAILRQTVRTRKNLATQHSFGFLGKSGALSRVHEPPKNKLLSFYRYSLEFQVFQCLFENLRHASVFVGEVCQRFVQRGPDLLHGVV